MQICAGEASRAAERRTIAVTAITISSNSRDMGIGFFARVNSSADHKDCHGSTRPEALGNAVRYARDVLGVPLSEISFVDKDAEHVSATICAMAL